MNAEPSICARPLPFPLGIQGWPGTAGGHRLGESRPGAMDSGGWVREPRTAPPELRRTEALPGPSCRRTDRCLPPGPAPVPSPSPRDWAGAPPRHERPPWMAVQLTEQLQRQREHSPGARRGARGRSRAQPSPPGRDRPARLRWKREEPRPPPTRETSALAVAPQALVGFRFRDAL